MFTDLVTGDVPGAATYFNPLMRQTIIPCTSGSRPTSPHEGMHAYETDTDRLIKWNGSSWEYVASTRASFTPTLSASTPPTLGTGNQRFGHYTYGPGPSVTFSFFISFGTSGTAAGSGNYSVSLPVTAASVFAGGHHSVGSILLADVSSGLFKTGAAYVGNGASSLAMIADGSQIVSNAGPWTWAASDYLSGTVTYPV